MVRYSAETAGRPTVLSCPKCMGILYESEMRGEAVFRCRSGHSYSLDDVCPAAEDSLGGILDTALAVLTK